MAIIKKKNSKANSSNGKFVWYQPSTQNQRLRTFLSSTCKEFDWRYEMSDFIFKGGVKAFLDILYSNRLSLHGKVRAIFFYTSD